MDKLLPIWRIILELSNFIRCIMIYPLEKTFHSFTRRENESFLRKTPRGIGYSDFSSGKWLGARGSKSLGSSETVVIAGASGQHALYLTHNSYKTFVICCLLLDKSTQDYSSWTNTPLGLDAFMVTENRKVDWNSTDLFFLWRSAWWILFRFQAWMDSLSSRFHLVKGRVKKEWESELWTTSMCTARTLRHVKITEYLLTRLRIRRTSNSPKQSTKRRFVVNETVRRQVSHFLLEYRCFPSPAAVTSREYSSDHAIHLNDPISLTNQSFNMLSSRMFRKFMIVLNDQVLHVMLWVRWNARLIQASANIQRPIWLIRVQFKKRTTSFDLFRVTCTWLIKLAKLCWKNSLLNDLQYFLFGAIHYIFLQL